MSYIIKSSFEFRALRSCFDLEEKKRINEIRRLYNDFMGSDDFTYKEYDE